jgi:HD-like signal output (HDOD) protein
VALLKRFSDTLRQLFGANKPATETAGDRALRLERKIQQLVDNMPAMPVTAARALALLEDPDVALADLAELVMQDTALATVLLRAANSALFAGGAQAVRLDQAVVRLGLWACKNLITAVGVRSVFRGRAVADDAECRALWHHGLVTAALASRINRAYRIGFNGEEYAAGLLHDLGRVLVALADRECFALAEMLDFREEGDLLGRERAAIGVDHCSLGAWFGDLSGLPGPLPGVIRHHHSPDRAPIVPRLVALTSAADHMANHLELGRSAAEYNPNTNAGLSCLTAKWFPGRREHLWAALPELMESAAEAAEREPAG